MAKDRIGFLGGATNLYEYAHGDAVNLVDLNGLAAKEVRTVLKMIADILTEDAVKQEIHDRLNPMTRNERILAAAIEDAVWSGIGGAALGWSVGGVAGAFALGQLGAGIGFGSGLVTQWILEESGMQRWYDTMSIRGPVGSMPGPIAFPEHKAITFYGSSSPCE